MKILARAAAFLTLFPGEKTRDPLLLGQLGRNAWWTFALVEAFAVGIAAGIALVVWCGLQAPLVAAACFLVVDHGLHGLRRLDGFSDLAEGIFYRLSNPAADREQVWKVVRAPQNGPYGTALIVLFLLLQWTLLARLFDFGGLVFLAGVVCTAMGSKLALAIAMAKPAWFREQSDFGRFAAAIGSTLRLLLLTGNIACACAGTLLLTHGWEARQSLLLVALIPPTAVLCGLLARHLVRATLGELNGDLIGFSWCCSEIVLLLLVNGMLAHPPVKTGYFL